MANNYRARKARRELAGKRQSRKETDQQRKADEQHARAHAGAILWFQAHYRGMQQRRRHKHRRSMLQAAEAVAQAAGLVKKDKTEPAWNAYVAAVGLYDRCLGADNSRLDTVQIPAVSIAALQKTELYGDPAGDPPFELPAEFLKAKADAEEAAVAAAVERGAAVRMARQVRHQRDDRAGGLDSGCVISLVAVLPKPVPGARAGRDDQLVRLQARRLESPQEGKGTLPFAVFLLSFRCLLLCVCGRKNALRSPIPICSCNSCGLSSNTLALSPRVVRP